MICNSKLMYLWSIFYCTNLQLPAVGETELAKGEGIEKSVKTTTNPHQWAAYDSLLKSKCRTEGRRGFLHFFVLDVLYTYILLKIAHNG